MLPCEGIKFIVLMSIEKYFRILSFKMTGCLHKFFMYIDRFLANIYNEFVDFMISKYDLLFLFEYENLNRIHGNLKVRLYEFYFLILFNDR